MPKAPKWNGQWHPFAVRFPMLGEQELRDMAASIADTGQLHSCVMNSEGLGLDGRNRVAACRIAGVEPTWTVNDGNPMSIIIAANVHHRFLTLGQRAMAVAVELEEKGMRQENGRWKKGSVPDAPDNATNSIRAWQLAMVRAGTIIDVGGDLVNRVLSGELELGTAYEDAQQEKERREGEEAETQERRRRADALPNDLAALVDNGVRDLDDAEREVQARKVVTEVDTIRNADGAPPPSFTDRVQDGTLTWSEAQTLAEEWKQEREQSLQRYEKNLRALSDSWQAAEDLAAQPQHPFFLDALSRLEPHRQETIHHILGTLKEAA